MEQSFPQILSREYNEVSFTDNNDTVHDARFYQKPGVSGMRIFEYILHVLDGRHTLLMIVCEKTDGGTYHLQALTRTGVFTYQTTEVLWDFMSWTNKAIRIARHLIPANI